jgi:sulfur transfer protein SufE
MTDYPETLQAVLDDFASISDRTERAEYLIEIADRFEDSAKVPPEVATQPYPEAHKVQACESDAYVWAVEQPDGTLKFYFDVLNPQGLSAKAISVILDETLSGQPNEAIMAVSSDIVFKIFGGEISMGKGAGLMGIVSMVQYEAKKRAQA